MSEDLLGVTHYRSRRCYDSQPNWKRPSGARSQRAAPYASMSPNRAIVQEKSRLLAELHRDSLYPMIGKDTWVAGADRRGSPRAEACASGASPPAPPPATRIRAPLEWWSSARSLQKSNPLVLAGRRPTLDRPLAAAGAQRQRLQACLPGGYKPPCLFSHCSPSLPESPQRPGVVSTGFSITSQGRSNRGSTKRTARTSRFVPSRCLHGAKSVAKLHSVQVNADRRDDDTWLTWLSPLPRLTCSSGAGKLRACGACQLLDVPERVV